MPAGGKINKDRDEQYAQNLAAGMLQLEAYHAAGFKGGSCNASRKAATPEMRIRVDAIHDMYLSKLIVNQQWIQREQVKTYFAARDDRDHHVCQKILKDMGIDRGLGVQRAEVLIHAKYERKTDAELLAELSQVLEAAEQQLALADHSEQPEEDNHE